MSYGEGTRGKAAVALQARPKSAFAEVLAQRSLSAEQRVLARFGRFQLYLYGRIMPLRIA